MRMAVRLRGFHFPVLGGKGNEIKRLGILFLFPEHNFITVKLQSGEVFLPLDDEISVAVEGEEFLRQARLVETGKGRMFVQIEIEITFIRRMEDADAAIFS